MYIDYEGSRKPEDLRSFASTADIDRLDPTPAIGFDTIKNVYFVISSNRKHGGLNLFDFDRRSVLFVAVMIFGLISLIMCLVSCCMYSDECHQIDGAAEENGGKGSESRRDRSKVRAEEGTASDDGSQADKLEFGRASIEMTMKEEDSL